MSKIYKILTYDITSILCLLISAILFIWAVIIIGFPPNGNLGTTAMAFLLASLFFFLIPIARKVTIGNFVSFEKEVNKIKNDVQEFKAETKDTLNLYSNFLNVISNTVTQTINVNLPGQEEAKKVKTDLDLQLGDKKEIDKIESEVDTYLIQSGNDINYALAKLRMDIERVLRNIMGKRLITPNPLQMQDKFMSARQLISTFINDNPKYKYLNQSFDFILKVCNAAIHGQFVDENYGREAIFMGLMIIKELDRFFENKEDPTKGKK